MSGHAKDYAIAGFAVGVPTVSVVTEINAYLAMLSFLIGVVLGLTRLWDRFKPTK